MSRPITGIRIIAFLSVVGSLGIAKAQTAVEQLQPLIETSAQRLSLAKEVALAKWDSGAKVEDIAREAHVIQGALKASESAGLDQQATETFFRAQIEANKIVQYSLLADWQRAGKAPAHPHIDLVATVRPELDRIQASLISELKESEKIRESSSCRVDIAKAAGRYLSTHKDQSSPLFAIALDRAAAGACGF